MNRTPCRTAAALLLPVLLLAAGCQRETKTVEEPSPPFVFRSLDLRQQDRQGRPAWQLRSPEARYDLRRRVAQARDPEGVIYANGQPLYRLSATRGTVINDGEAILLEGQIRVDRLGDQPLQIRASRARWLPRRDRLIIDRAPEAFDRQNRLSARRAIFKFDKGLLEMRGRPRLQHWARSFDPRHALPAGPPETLLTVDRADWYPGTGVLETRGLVRGTRRPAGRPADRPAQTLIAGSLSGNTIQQRYTLGSPVRFEDPVEGNALTTGSVAIDLPAQRASTDAAFQGRRGSLQASGVGLDVDGKQQQATIAAGCRIEQPGENLRAERCQWNWSTQDVEADGPLELRRSSNDQLTRGTRLRGRLGNDGTIEVSAPGGRVVSRFRARPARSASPR
ncbi:LPS export ABC transporter periplasmic protein LptC [Cyanobium sp. FGCU-6]|nr:LPS export ABC transporter periplasmic protein LptC [Cyanobium sp. FGCU6]